MPPPERPCSETTAELDAARVVACRVATDHWPELVDVEPTVAPRRRMMPAPDLLAELGLDKYAAPPAPAEQNEYTFTFVAETSTPEGHRAPRVARVTIDAQRRVIKATFSK